MVRPAPGGGPAAREPGLGTGRGGDVTGSAISLFSFLRRQRAETTGGAACGVPKATQVFGSDCDCRLTKW
jgi:hypothetical protein